MESLRYNSKRKLEPYQVRLLRQMHREGFSRRWMSQLFKISAHSLQQLLAGSTYKNVK